MVSKVETGDARPSGQFAAACDSAFPEMGGMFADLVEAAGKSHDVYPAWFQSWVDAEKRATVLRWWEPLLIPGLLQTADYARAPFESWRTVDGNGDTDTNVAGRLARQAIFDQASPPSFGAVIDEGVLYRCIGGPKVMHDQLLHLADTSERPRITVQGPARTVLAFLRFRMWLRSSGDVLGIWRGPLDAVNGVADRSPILSVA